MQKTRSKVIESLAGGVLMTTKARMKRAETLAVLRLMKSTINTTSPSLAGVGLKKKRY